MAATAEHLDRRLPDVRRCVPVRLTQIDLDRRLKAAREICRREVSLEAKLEIIAAATNPSDRIYFVAEGADIG